MDRLWTKFIDVLLAGGPIPVAQMSRVGNYWSSRLAATSGQRWTDICFFDLEFFFYHWINSQVGFFRNGTDVFSEKRKQSAQDVAPAFAAAYDRLSVMSGLLRLTALIQLSTDGNVADLSQIEETDALAAKVLPRLTDDSNFLTEVLRSGPPLPVHFIADNFGHELMWDLALIDTVISDASKPVVLHLKPCPMFVSDAVVGDVGLTLAAFDDQFASTRTLAHRLRDAVASGILSIEASTEWGEPRFFSQLSVEMTSRLCSASVLIAKGDLNYRRIVEDRLWPAETPVSTIPNLPSVKTFALRVLKSDAILGLKKTLVAKLDRLEPYWRSSGTKAIIQRLR